MRSIESRHATRPSREGDRFGDWGWGGPSRRRYAAAGTPKRDARRRQVHLDWERCAGGRPEGRPLRGAGV